MWWRDSRWDGTTQHWSRGNGWIVAALTDTVANLPAGDPHRAHYVSLVQDMFAKQKASQQAGGYWTADVDHPAAYPAPESSGTSLFTYEAIQAGYATEAGLPAAELLAGPGHGCRDRLRDLLRRHVVVRRRFTIISRAPACTATAHNAAAGSTCNELPTARNTSLAAAMFLAWASTSPSRCSPNGVTPSLGIPPHLGHVLSPSRISLVA